MTFFHVPDGMDVPASGRRECCPSNGAEHDDYIARWITRSGSYQVRAVCKSCKARSGSIPFVELEVFGLAPEDVPVIEDLREDACEVCGELGVETHHWAPWAVFGSDAVRWPTAELCRACHRYWHSRMTPRSFGLNMNAERSA